MNYWCYLPEERSYYELEKLSKDALITMARGYLRVLCLDEAERLEIIARAKKTGRIVSLGRRIDEFNADPQKAIARSIARSKAAKKAARRRRRAR
ncbi:hypothetical protein H7849_11760 [Alloacidobacterium dinghuense]|uniref:Uncharacterized protein n=1 Tax=Alloacidobacterium dinghuense TaxID=2763107 RepID=A0A7G8BPN1_9BACT|nr:hypothetical protein [Alloacidobacterium dinghuense]QNI34501.1 hypothetical protein H7849_11760 [Alloacidobacterium dinghuense]